MSIRVIIADDHEVVRAGLRATIERAGSGLTIVGEASDGMEVLQLAETMHTDVFILDITMPKLNGIDATRALLKKTRDARVIILSLHDAGPMVHAALDAGARGYLTKDSATRHVVDAVREVHAGRFYLAPQVAHFAIGTGSRGAPRSGQRRGLDSEALTPRERRVLQLIAEGQSTKEIAVTLGLAANTVHGHRNRLMAKLGLHKAADLTRYAISAGLAKA